MYKCNFYREGSEIRLRDRILVTRLTWIVGRDVCCNRLPSGVRAVMAGRTDAWCGAVIIDTAKERLVRISVCSCVAEVTFSGRLNVIGCFPRRRASVVASRADTCNPRCWVRIIASQKCLEIVCICRCMTDVTSGSRDYVLGTLACRSCAVVTSRASSCWAGMNVGRAKEGLVAVGIGRVMAGVAGSPIDRNVCRRHTCCCRPIVAGRTNTRWCGVNISCPEECLVVVGVGCVVTGITGGSRRHVSCGFSHRDHSIVTRGAHTRLGWVYVGNPPEGGEIACNLIGVTSITSRCGWYVKRRLVQPRPTRIVAIRASADRGYVNESRPQERRVIGDRGRCMTNITCRRSRHVRC